MLKYLNLSILMMLSITNSMMAQSRQTNVGPAHGTLFIVGGGFLQQLLPEFIELAGGKDAPIIVIPNADGNPRLDNNHGDAVLLRKLGATNVTVLQATDSKTANSEAFVQKLKQAKAIWFGGGRHWRIIDAYKNTLAEKAFREILDNGGVIGGTSAGASVMGSYLARGDSKDNQTMNGDHQVGLGYLNNVTIDQHVLARNRQFDMFTVLKKHPKLLGIGIDEETAIIVRGNEFEVTGKSYVLVYDGTFWSDEGFELKKLPAKKNLFYFLKKGNKYDLLNRKVIK